MSEQAEPKRVNVAIPGALHERASFAAAAVNLNLQELTEAALELWLSRNGRWVNRETKRKQKAATA